MLTYVPPGNLIWTGASRHIYKLAALRKAFYLATFFSIYYNNKRRLFAENGWGMLAYAPGWSLPSQFRSYPPPKNLFFPRPKN